MINSEALYALIAARLKELRLTKQISQDKVAEVLGLSRASIINFEKGSQKISLHILYQYCELLGTDVKNILPDADIVSEKKSISADKAVEKVKEDPLTRAVLERYLSNNNDTK